jgi:hypothetical protein
VLSAAIVLIGLPARAAVPPAAGGGKVNGMPDGVDGPAEIGSLPTVLNNHLWPSPSLVRNRFWNSEVVHKHVSQSVTLSAAQIGGVKV